MFHDGGGILDALDVFINVDILVWGMQITSGVGKSCQHARDPHMLEDRTLGRNPVDDGRLAVNFMGGSDN